MGVQACSPIVVMALITAGVWRAVTENRAPARPAAAMMPWPAVRQPTIRRENTSETNAVNAIPDQVGTYVKSTTHSSFGRVAVKFRSTRSGGLAAARHGVRPVRI